MEKLYSKDNKGIFRLIRDANNDEIVRGKVKDDSVFVLAKSLDSEFVLFVHSTRRGKKVYRANKKDIIIEKKKNGNFVDNLSEETKKKLGIIK